MKKQLLLIPFALFFIVQLYAQIDLKMKPVTGMSFNSPVDIAHDGVNADRLYIVEKAGRIRIVTMDDGDTTKLATPFLNISSLVSNNGERGLLGLAFHPNYSSANPYFFVNYTDIDGDTHITRYSVSSPDATAANPTSAKDIIIINQLQSNHNGGDMEFGPDGYLYIPLGDGGGSNDPDDVSQDPQELLGKMLRIDINNGDPYSIPSSNPFAGDPSTLDEIWALGLRNPWRFSFDRLTGDMWIGDVGQGAREEINFEPESSTRGENYGWDCREGNTSGPGSCGGDFTDPIFDMTRSLARSVTGGYVYRGETYAMLVGKYIFCDYATDNCWTLTPDGFGGVTSKIYSSTGISQCSTFGEDLDGDLYAASLGGTIYTVADANDPLPVELGESEGIANGSTNTLNWQSITEENVAFYEVQRSSNATDWEIIGKVDASGNSLETKSYTFQDMFPREGENYYRLRMVDLDETFEYSPIISINRLSSNDFQLLPNPNFGSLTVQLTHIPEDPIEIQIFDLMGKIVYSNIKLFAANQQQFDISHLTDGIYIVKIQKDGNRLTDKLIVR